MTWTVGHIAVHATCPVLLIPGASALRRTAATSSASIFCTVGHIIGAAPLVMVKFSRDATMTAAIFGFFAMGWFGWAQEHPPRPWTRWLRAGSACAALILVVAAVLAWRLWDTATVFDAGTGRTSGIVVGCRVRLAGVGAGLLTRRNRKELVPAWIAAVVGVHLLPLEPLLHYPLLYPVAALVTMAAVLAVPVARRGSLPVSAVNGLGVGVVLLTAAILSLTSALTRA
ncbi:hypothetical protein GCM10009557_23030 [Virgisporangium ochraceum]|uniref:Uncharacterized protein n=1 Tax=Virgisporangium ochraceum TaxID=65505 RepID=A0A8J4A6J5_9ACTN|nr:hypothetical protein [Virgisporangium ochraceum]GIJ75128.1 hypothetical protein Voc01_100450 [Virgisporangium ochraceum]